MSTEEKKFHLQSVVFNRTESKFNVIAETNTIRTSLLYSHCVHILGSAEILFNKDTGINVLDVYEKIEFLKEEVGDRSEGLTKEKLDAYKDSIKYYKKKKHKTKKELLHLYKITNYINRVVARGQKNLDKSLEVFGFDELVPFKESNQIRTYKIPLDAEASGMPDKVIDLLNVVLKTFWMYPVLDGTVENIGMNKALMQKHFWNNLRKKNLFFVKQFLFRIPETSMFNYSQTVSTRNAILESFEEFINYLSVYSYRISRMKFGFLDRLIYDLQFKKILYPQLAKVQKIIDDCPFISYARNLPSYKTEYEVYLCLAPVKNIIRIYTELEIISKTTELYILEKLRSEIDVEKCKAFFCHKAVKV